MFLASPLTRAADANSDNQVTKEEMSKLAARWFGEWDTKRSGQLKQEDLREGINKTLTASGGPGPGLNLQGREGKRNGLASAAGIEFNYVKADLEIDGKRLNNVAVRYKGNGTWMGSRFDKKRSMKVDVNEHVKGQKYAGTAKLNFHNCVTDASYMNEVLSHRLYRDAGVPAPRTAYARVSVMVPGKHDHEYFGLYSVVENIDDDFAEDRFGKKKGAILKPVTPRPFEYLGADWASYSQTYDPKTNLSDEDKKRIIEFCELVSKASDEDFNAKVGEYLDLDNFSRFMAVTVWLSTLDSILGVGQNYYVYLHPKTRKLHFIPWDLDHSFGQFFLMGSQEQREKLSIEKPWQGQIRFLERVYKTEGFQKMYRARFEEFSKTIFRPERFLKQVDEVAAAIRPAVKDESDSKVERFDKVVAGEAVAPSFGPPPGGGGQRVGPPPGFMQPAKPIKAFVKQRAQSVSDQLEGKAKGETLQFGFGGGPSGPRGFGPGMFLGPAFEAQFDGDKSGTVSDQEFIDGFNRWFQQWDKEKSGSLSEDQIRAGLNETFRPPPFGGGPARTQE